jgi:Fe-S cluster biogenesis protein NfuA
MNHYRNKSIMSSDTLTQQEIKIQAQVLDELTCQFTVDRPVLPDGAVCFRSKDSAVGSPLAEKIFAIEGVTGIIVRDTIVKVSSTGYVDWLPVARQIGAIIRSQLQSGDPAIAKTVLDDIPPEETIRQKVQQVFDADINPYVAMHGGFVDLVDVKRNVVYLRFGGGCQGCGMASVTLKRGVERAIREAVPEVADILDVTDHAAGMNPYYR